MNIKSSAVAGVRWTAVTEIVTSILQFIQVIVLARLLAPDDFGLMAMVLAVLGLAQAYADLGISNALIYHRTTTREQLSSLYWLNIFAGAVVFGLALLAAPLAAAVFDEPRLKEPLMLAACIFLIAPPGQQFQILLQKHLRFRDLARAEITAAFLGAVVAMAAALGGLGVYALVWGNLALVAVRAGLLMWCGWTQWRPFLHFRRSDLRGYVGFGLYQMGERTINYINFRWDQVLIGSMLGAQALGYYHLAHMLVMRPVMRLNPVVTRVAFPVFARIQSDTNTLKAGYLLMLRGLTSVNFPLLFGLAAVAPWFIPIAFGEQWLPAVLPLQILSVVGLLRSIGDPLGALLLARGRADLTFKWNMALLLIYVPALTLGAHLGGIIGVAWSVLIVQMLASLANYWFLLRSQLGPCLGAYLQTMAPAFWISSLMAITVLVLKSLGGAPSVLGLGLVIAAGGAVYVGLYYLVQREQFLNFKDMILRA